MAKSFKKLVSEVAEPKSAGEKAFKDQHTVEKLDAQPAGQDHIFSGQTPPKKRLADYLPGADSAAYDKASKLPDQGGDDSIVDMGEEAEEPDAASELNEDPFEEKPMMMGQLRMMAHNLQGIARYVAKTEDPEEWFQNKLAGVAKEMQTLYGYATAETMAMGEDVDYKVDGRRTSFKEKAKKLGYVKGDDVEEDAFLAKAAHSKMAGKDKMKMGDKEYPVTMSKLNAAKIKSACESVEEILDEARGPKPPQISKGTAKGSISAKGIRGKGMKKFDVDVSVDNGKFSFRIQDESGKFQTVDIKKAARMLGEEVETDLDEGILGAIAGGALAHKMGGGVLAKVAGAAAGSAIQDRIAGKKKKEEAEVNEISKDLAGRYIRKAQVDSADAGRDTNERDPERRKRGINKFLKRRKGTDMAVKRLMKKEEVELEEKKGRKLTPKEMRRALQTAKAQPKDKVSLKKAPFDIPKESVELEEKVTFKTGIITLDDGQKVKLSRQDADLLTRFFKDLNPRNSKEMRKVLVTDKDGFEEILGFAREAL